MTQRDFARSTPRAFCSRSTVAFGRDVAPAEVLGERAAHELAIRLRVERLERHALFTRRGFGVAGALVVERQLRPGTSPNAARGRAPRPGSRCTAGMHLLEVLRKHDARHGALIDFFCSAFTRRTSPSARCVLAKTGTAAVVLAADRSTTTSAASARSRGAPTPAATTTRLPR